MKASVDNNYRVKDKENKIYVINLDINRIFWLIAITLFLISFFFFTGYWLGNKIDYDNITEKQDKWSIDSLSDQEIKDFSNIKEVKNVTREALKSFGNSFPYTQQKHYAEKEEIKTNTNKSIITNPKDNSLKVYDPKNKDYSIQNTKKNSVENKSFEKKKKRKTAALQKNTYSLQIASYKVAHNAYSTKKQLYKKWKNKVYLLIKKNNENKYIYTIYLGPFASLNKAKAAKANLIRKATFKDSFIIKN